MNPETNNIHAVNILIVFPAAPNACDPNPCKNYGICILRANTPSGYECHCYPDFEGENCEIQITTTAGMYANLQVSCIYLRFVHCGHPIWARLYYNGN